MATAAATAAAAKGIPKEFAFLWEGKDKSGKVVRGEMRAHGVAVAAAICRVNGMPLFG